MIPACPRTTHDHSYRSFAALYDRLLGDRMFPLVRRNFSWLVRHHGIRYRSCADIACGTGAFLRAICRPGHLAFGVDRSPSMLALASQRNRGNGAMFLLQDMRRLRLPCPVDLITCNFDSLNYLLSKHDLALAFGCFRQNLTHRGHAIFDMVTDLAAEPRPAIGLQLFRLPGVTSLWRASWNPVRQLRTVSMLNYFEMSDRLKREWHVQRPYSIAVIVALLRSCGLALRGVHDAHSLAAAGPATYRAVYVVSST
jgi:SAM-dependent methyltransferase